LVLANSIPDDDGGRAKDFPEESAADLVGGEPTT